MYHIVFGKCRACSLLRLCMVRKNEFEGVAVGARPVAAVAGTGRVLRSPEERFPSRAVLLSMQVRRGSRTFITTDFLTAKRFLQQNARTVSFADCAVECLLQQSVCYSTCFFAFYNRMLVQLPLRTVLFECASDA